jgi:hypothetical protein
VDADRPRRQVEFPATVGRELEQAAGERREVRNVYGLRAPDSDDLQREIQAALTRPTSEDDTHPSPEERFRLTAGAAAAREWPDHREVWDLFVDRERLAAEMTAKFARPIEPVEASDSVPVTAEHAPSA